VREVDEKQPESVHLCKFPIPDKSLKDAALVERMDLAREAVNLGRVLRSRNKIRTRQPLASLSIAVRTQDQRDSLISLEDLIKDELNVKTLNVSLDEDGMVKFKAKANFKVLGWRMGKAMKDVAQKVNRFSHEDIKNLLKGGTMDIEEGVLKAEDIVVIREVKEGMAVEVGERLTVALDTVITKELLSEGLARECVNKIQNLRKESGFAVTDRIVLTVNTKAPIFKETLKIHETHIISEVLADSLNFIENSLDSGSIIEYNGQTAAFQVQKKE